MLLVCIVSVFQPCGSHVVAIVSDGHFVESATSAQTSYVVLDKTNFSQHDKGFIDKDGVEFL